MLRLFLLVVTRRDTCFLGRLSQGDTGRKEATPLLCQPCSVLILFYYLAVFVFGFIVSVTGLASDKLGWVLFMFVDCLRGYYQLVMYWIIFVLSYLD